MCTFLLSQAVVAVVILPVKVVLVVVVLADTEVRAAKVAVLVVRR